MKAQQQTNGVTEGIETTEGPSQAAQRDNRRAVVGGTSQQSAGAAGASYSLASGAWPLTLMNITIEYCDM